MNYDYKCKYNKMTGSLNVLLFTFNIYCL